MALAGALAGGVSAVVAPLVLAPLIGWDAAALSWLVLVWRTLWPLDARRTARLAVHEDPNRIVRDVLVLGACLASLVAVAVVLASAHRVSPGLPRNVYSGLGVASVLLSWLVVHTVFTARYARVYYTGTDGGVVFHQSEPPRYSDFAYVAFTVGMTFQVSDTNLTSNEMRTTVLGHSLLSYLFGAIVIAATVNLLAGLAH
ncbi:putative membrane protein [Micromonospora olivasterospora]|uniref:Putative membrane protein n=2 Tax=Micromonospora olivasterospora TaxID=1880 RepID=A0A562IFB4_MICOL|nr:putative membrane protein [Micromonospora olivasterospora]